MTEAVRPDLLERESAVRDLRAAQAAARNGRGSTRLIVGPAGIGKSAMLEVVREISQEDDSLVLTARASELDRGFAFGIVHQLLEPVMEEAGEARRQDLLAGAAGRAAVLFGPAITEVDPEYGVLSGLYWLVANLAEESPVVLCVDDLHWADIASLRFLEYLGRRIDGLPVLLAGTTRSSRPDAVADLLVALESSPSTGTLRPEAVSREATARILGRFLDAEPSEAFLEAAWNATGGNPLLVTTLAREAEEQGLTGSAAEAEGLTERTAGGVTPAVGRRLRLLGEEATTVARGAAVLGERARREDLVALSGLDRGRVSDSLVTLAEAGMLKSGDGPAFSHPLVQAAVVELIPRRERDQLHRRAATQLRSRNARPAEVALHWLAASPAADPRAVEDLRSAASEAAAGGAASAAAELLRRALAEGAEIDDRPRLQFELAELELQTMDPEGPERMRAALAAGLADEEAARGHAALGRVLMLADPEAGLAEIDAALAATTDRGLRLRLEALSLEARVLAGAAPLSLERKDLNPSVVALAHSASREALSGTVSAGQVAETAMRAVAGDTLLREVGPGGATWNLLTHALRFAERPDEAGRLLTEGRRVVNQRGLRAAGAFVDQSWAYWHRDFGSVARGLAHAQSAYEEIVDAKLPISVWSLTSAMAENLVLLDRVPEADALLDGQLGPAEGTFVEPFALTARGLARMLNGRLEEAERDLRRVVQFLDWHGWHAPAAARGRIRLAELLAMSGREGEALELTAEDQRWAEAAGTNGALGCVLRVRALAERGGERIATQRHAVAALSASPLLIERGRALADLGVSLRRNRQMDEARTVLREALDVASRGESALLQRQVRTELEASGARPRRERISGLESLTPSERRVADLAAEGLTNREIAETLWVTRKTVEYHLGNVYPKLGIGSRSGLAEVLKVV